MKNTIDISIIVATFNRPGDTLDLLESISNSFGYCRSRVAKKIKIELIIADNSLNNETKRLIMEKRLKYLRYIKLKPLGVSFVRDYAISKAKYPYILIIDSDCVVRRDWLFSFYKTIIANNFPDVIQGAYFYPYAKNWVSFSESEWDRIRFYTQKQADTRNFLIKKSAYFHIGGFNKKHFYSTGAEDLFLLERLREDNATIIFNDKIIVYHKYPGMFRELKRYEGYGKASINIKFEKPDLFKKEFSPWALWKNLFGFRFGIINPLEFVYQFFKLSWFTKGYFIGKKHYFKELKKGRIISPLLND